MIPRVDYEIQSRGYTEIRGKESLSVEYMSEEKNLCLRHLIRQESFVKTILEGAVEGTKC